MNPNIFQKILSLIYLIIITICCIFIVPFRNLKGKFESEIVYSSIWSENSNIDLYRIGISLLATTIIFCFWYRYLDKMNQLDKDIYKRKARIELKIFIFFAISILGCYIILVSVNLVNKLKSNSLVSKVENLQKTILQEYKINSQTDHSRNTEIIKNSKDSINNKLKYYISKVVLGKLSTTLSTKPNLTSDELFLQFPEFQNNSELLQIALDYLATSKSGKYKTEQEINSKFPELEFNPNSYLASKNRENKAIKLYNNLINDGFTIESLGTIEEFINKISDSLSSSNLYDELLKGGYTKYNLSSKSEFIETFFVRKSLLEIQKVNKKNLLNEEIVKLKLKNQNITYLDNKEITQISSFFFLILFGILYLFRPMILFTKGLFVELK